MRLLLWFESLSMEATFAITGIGILAAGIGLGLLVAWLLEKREG